MLNCKLYPIIEVLKLNARITMQSGKGLDIGTQTLSCSSASIIRRA